MRKQRPDMPTMSVPFRLRRLWNGALDRAYPGAPSVCVMCHRVIPPMSVRQLKNLSAWAETPESLGQFICPFCLQEAKGVKPKPMVRELPVPATRLLVHVYSVYRYEGFVQRAIRPWKYDGALGLTDWFASTMTTTIRACRLTQQVDCIVPVPTSPTRLRQRGYHHTLLLAKAVGRASDLEVVQALQRGVSSMTAGHLKSDAAMEPDAAGGDRSAFAPGHETQTAKSAQERRASLAGVFTVADGRDVRGARVLLLDDVVTTGATMQSCAEQLLRAGAVRVVCIAIADVV
ncbi:ComF family protein [Alicyclobacillus mengziensis]|uniref:ComF family protein n=1 Tax=Alicyclobacillus mengziensis TaxID=2931921 RepID=A0A9X7Z8F0_9BACL|nr:phosphoribosyltransferase family protein [Alicyclobacillus mengziensis]QSO48136.1 ComF family protein [Alicyclobacillus mengziensis]